MKAVKEIPVNLHYSNSGNFTEVIDEFVDLMQDAVGKDVDVEIDLTGKVTFHFGKNIPVKIETRPQVDYDALYRGDYMGEVIK